MKKICKVILAAAAVVALAVPAMAADKLIVKGTDGISEVFKVSDSGKIGFNVPTPLSPIDVANQGTNNNSVLHFSKTGADSGGWISSDGENNFWISSGATYQNGVWTQKAASGQSIFFGSGGAGFTAFLNQGGVVGSPVTATAKFRLLYNGNFGIGTLAAKQTLEVNGGIRMNTAIAQVTCDAATGRGTLWFTNGAAGVKDSLQVCAKDAADAYAWRIIY